jgi:hypothetical protein
MSEDLLDIVSHNGKPDASKLDVPEKFRDPATGGIRC